jgi:[acyl-carrier-protein] S-malonyltransferase
MIAYIFPGQGSQVTGMGQDLFTHFSEARSVFEEADRSLEFSLSDLCFKGPEERLKLTENTQPAILAVSIAAFRVLCARGQKPSYVAGHSLGEYSALVAAGSLDLSQALQTVRKRGKYMQEAVPIGEGAMAAILGAGKAQVAELCQEASQGEILAAANLNSPSQIVISGAAAAVNRALALAKSKGIRRAMLLPVSAPFHCGLMQSAQQRLSQDLERIVFRDLEFPLINNADAMELRAGSSIPDSLSRQVCAPVRWTETVERLVECGVRLFVELGPGKVLSGLVRQIDKNLETAHVEDSKSLAETLEILSRHT